MDIISSAKRLFLRKTLAIIYESGMMLMRKDPEAARKQLIASGKSDEGFDDIFSLPDFVIKRIAECTAEAVTEDPRMTQILKGEAEIESAKLTKKLAAKPDVVNWFEKTRTEHAPSNVSEQQIKRDGAILLCRKAAGYFERGMFLQAETFFSRAVEIDDTYVDGWSGLADTFKALGDQERAGSAQARADSLKS